MASGTLLSAEQESQLADLVQQAKRAVQQCGVRPAAQLAQAAATAMAAGQPVNGPPDAELALVLRRGVAAQQLLVTANMRLVSLTRRRLQAGQQLGEPLFQASLAAQLPACPLASKPRPSLNAPRGLHPARILPLSLRALFLSGTAALLARRIWSWQGAVRCGGPPQGTPLARGRGAAAFPPMPWPPSTMP